MKVALIGYGYWGKKLFRYLQAAPGLELARVHFPSLRSDDSPLLALNEEHGGIFTPEIETIWKDESIAGVAIATPIDTHFTLARAALERGRHVFVEKPLCAGAAEAEELGKLRAARSRCLVTDYTHSFSPSLAKARALAASGELGALISVEIRLRQFGRFLEFDVLDLLGSHGLSVLALFADLRELDFRLEPLLWNREVLSSARIGFQGARLRGAISVDLYSVKREKSARLVFERGALAFDALASPSLRRVDFHAAAEISDENFDEGNNIALALDFFRNAARGASPDNFREAADVSAVMEKLRASDDGCDIRYSTGV